MRYRFKKAFSRLLVLVVAFSAVQSTEAININSKMQENQLQQIELSLTSVEGVKVSDKCLIEHDDDNCVEVDCCETLCNSPSLQFPCSALLNLTPNSPQLLLISTEPIFSYHPDLLKRPPKA